VTRFYWHAVVLVAACACSEKSKAPAPLASAPAPLASAPAPLASAAPPPPRAPPPAPEGEGESMPDILLATKACRAITVKGGVTAESGRKVMAGDPLDQPSWLDLAPKAELAVKHAETAREVVFYGPAHVLPCERGEERFLMTGGRAVTATWAGARPGAEVLIATPLAVVRYGDATLEIRVREKTLSVQSAVGDGVIDVGDGSDGERVSAGGHTVRKSTGVDVKSLVTECDSGALASESLARVVLAPGGSKAPLGERASAHVRGRKAARIKCAIAAAALGTLEKGQDRDALAQTVARAEARWRGVPSAIPPRPSAGTTQ
jgi:hypothetical protein